VFPEFLASVEAEARDNIERLRHHPALVMLCGNNEDCTSRRNIPQLIQDQQITQWDMDQDGDPLPARVIYEQLLPRLIKDLVDPAIPYWPGSPYGGKGWDTSDPTTGDVVSACAHSVLTCSINGMCGRAKSTTTSTGIDLEDALFQSSASLAFRIVALSTTG